MIAHKDAESGKISGLINVKLDKGWKTYWRSPGASGIPPEFNFSSSQNIRVSKIQFPVPQWITLPDAKFYGYQNKVSFVFEAEADAYDTQLNLDLLIGVCEEICIPAMANFELSAGELNSSDPRATMDIALARSFLPIGADDSLRLDQFQIEDQKIKGALAMQSDHGVFDIVVELPGEWVSDPLHTVKNSEGRFQFEASLPSSIAQKELADRQWFYSIIQRDEDTSEVIKAVTGTFPKEPS